MQKNQKHEVLRLINYYLLIMEKKKTEELLNLVIKASIEAGEEILEIYNTEFSVELKDDKSPLTKADTKSNNVITRYLSQLDIPILSEEGKDIAYEERKEWKQFWLVDPLDGTKEFIKRNGEFTVNIALIEDRTPVMGVIYVPVLDILYFGYENGGSYKLENARTKDYKSIADLVAQSTKLPIPQGDRPFTAVGSKSHMNEETEEFINSHKEIHGEIQIMSRGSSIKLCMVAEGKADIYPRYAPTMEWDTGAGHAIAKFSGSDVFKANTNEELEYNKENLKNPWFLVKRASN